VKRRERKNEKKMIAFGPVPSRRLGQSLGINNIPPKICTYSCIYCQVGRTLNMQVERKAFYKPEDIISEVKEKIRKTKGKGDLIDYLTFVPDGEPTLDVNLGHEIELLKKSGIKTAVITNSSLLWKKEVRNELSAADWVSLKIDTVNESTWQKINRPHGALKFEEILNGILEFADTYERMLTTETMITRDINDSLDEMNKVSDFISKINPKQSYIAVPTRPPAENYVQSPTERFINRAYHLFRERLIPVEYLIGYEGNAFAFTGDVKNDLLSITSVHPMREDGVKEFLKKANADWRIIERLIEENKLVEVTYNRNRFYLRKIKR
jgi:wyosine [tRNA(Phe)-imidazoG37] synthetase (radical SAM superfamily)